MTKQELIQMCGTEEQANYAMEILIKNVKVDFVKMAIKAEISETKNQIKKLKDLGFIYSSNGTLHVNWGKADELNGFNLSDEEEKRYEEASQKCHEADSLLYRNNRLTSLISVR